MDMTTDYAEGWRPDPGAVIVGRVTEVGIGSSQFGGAYPIVTVAPEGGGDPIAVHCFHAALKNKMLTLKPMAGERIGIKYLGARAHKTDPRLTVEDYTVKVDGRSGADVWAQMGAPAGPTHAPAQQSIPTADFNPPTAPAAQPGAPDDDIPF